MSAHNVQSELENSMMTSTGSFFKSPEGLTFGFGKTVGNGIEGWAPGAIFVDTDAAQGSQVMVNTGTKASATWTEIADAGVAGGFALTGKLEVGAGGSVDINGISDGLILDADADTTISADVDDQIDVKVGGTDVVSIVPTGMQDNGVEAVTAIAGGASTGLITQGSKWVTATSDGATKQISLPAASIGDVINITVTGAACELISAVAAHKVNNVTVGATNELALVENSTYRCEYVAVNTWVVRGFTNLGADEAALVPNAL